MSPGIHQLLYGIIFPCSISAISLVLFGSLGLLYHVQKLTTSVIVLHSESKQQEDQEKYKITNEDWPSFLRAIAPLNRVESFSSSWIWLLQFAFSITFTATSSFSEEPLGGWGMREQRKEPGYFFYFL